MSTKKKSYLGLVTVESPAQGRLKTYIWTVYGGAGAGARLGQVKWYGPWRRYCFFPEPATLFDTSCLDEIRSWLEMATKHHKEGLVV